MFNDNPVPRMGEIVTALFQAAGEMKDEEMRGYAAVRKLFRKALDITGLLADVIDSELMSKVLTAEAQKARRDACRRYLYPGRHGELGGYFRRTGKSGSRATGHDE